MHDHLKSFKQNASQNFTKTLTILKNPKIFPKIPKPRSKMNEMHEKGKKRDHTKWRTQGLDQKLSGEGEECECEEFGREMREFLSREIGENEK